MRVLFLTLYPERAASARYRVGQFIPYLRAHGVDCTVAPAVTEEQYARHAGPGRRGRALWYHLAETPRRLSQILSAPRYDVVFVQKAVMSAYVRGAGGLLRRLARRVVLDVDDAVHLCPPHPLRGVWRGVEDRSQVHRLFAQADLVLAGNSWLAAAVEEAGGKAALFPTVVDTDRFAPAAEPASGYCVGWIGGPSTTPSLAEAAEALVSLSEATVRLVGADEGQSLVPNAAVTPWHLDTEVADVQSFSVGVMPLAKDEWTRGKCALKALQYMACGVPCVVTPYGAVLDIVRHGENGLFADSSAEWREALERLRAPALRTRLAVAGRATVEESYSLKKAAPKLLHHLESLA